MHDLRIGLHPAIAVPELALRVRAAALVAAIDRAVAAEEIRRLAYRGEIEMEQDWALGSPATPPPEPVLAQRARHPGVKLDPQAHPPFRDRAHAGPVVLGGNSAADVAATVGGSIEFILNEGYTMTTPDPSISGIFGALSSDEFEDFILNSFDPADQNTYNHATSTTIYDSLGNSHVMTQFFVKEPLDPTRPGEANLWAMYIQIDGNDVGDPDSTLSFPENLVATSARYELFFNPDGTFDELATGSLYVTNWDPLGEDGAATGSLSSLNVLEGGLPLTDPATNSNFEISLDGSTQFGSNFSVTEVSQNGFTTGRLTGLEIDTDGLMFARFTNGQAQVLGQVSLATFKNPEGLVPLGGTSWGESFESGGATIGSPRTGTFGNLRSSALEESNVDLSEELVGLIIAQRNFQANAKTIETSDTVTQTIIQL